MMVIYIDFKVLIITSSCPVSGTIWFRPSSCKSNEHENYVNYQNDDHSVSILLMVTGLVNNDDDFIRLKVTWNEAQ